MGENANRRRIRGRSLWPFWVGSLYFIDDTRALATASNGRIYKLVNEPSFCKDININETFVYPNPSKETLNARNIL